MALTDLRDKLALERTQLANERTFLAYVRTSLSLLAGGAVIFQFFFNQPYYLTIAWLLIGLGGAFLIVGIVRFFQVRTELNTNT